MIYFASKYNRASQYNTWTAISRTPWMKAIALFEELGTWQGGGHFIDNRTYSLNSDHEPRVIQQTNEVTLVDGAIKPKERDYHARLLNSGWKLRPGRGSRIFDKPLPRGWTLTKFVYMTKEVHELTDNRHHTKKYSDWQWADLNDNRLVWAAAGCLYACSLASGTELGSAQLLYDFNAMTFQAVEAPY